MTDTAIELLDRMNRHLSIMQCQMRQYLEPSGRGVGFSHDNKARADQFINDMICLLDGPEQRDVQDKARALLKSRLTDMTAQTDELPPCPFCGNEPVLLTATRSEEHTAELQTLMRISYAVFRLKKTTGNTRPVTQPATV